MLEVIRYLATLKNIIGQLCGVRQSVPEEAASTPVEVNLLSSPAA